ncbi:MAG: hypothetical protein QXI02_06185 [Candidatus Caldarchaeum sp.]
MANYVRRLCELVGLEDKYTTMLEEVAAKTVEELKKLLEVVEDDETPF